MSGVFVSTRRASMEAASPPACSSLPCVEALFSTFVACETWKWHKHLTVWNRFSERIKLAVPPCIERWCPESRDQYYRTTCWRRSRFQVLHLWVLSMQHLPFLSRDCIMDLGRHVRGELHRMVLLICPSVNGLLASKPKIVAVTNLVKSIAGQTHKLRLRLKY